MEDLFLKLKRYRKKQGLSQQSLAAKAGLSLATVQNIESGRSNPAWETLGSLFEILGLQFDLQPQSMDWDQLAGLGCPLMSNITFNKRNLTHENLISALQQLSNHIDSLSINTREYNAFYAFLYAIKDHYPSIWLELNDTIKAWFAKQHSPVSIKLRRLALQKLGTYL